MSATFEFFGAFNFLNRTCEPRQNLFLAINVEILSDVW